MSTPCSSVRVPVPDTVTVLGAPTLLMTIKAPFLTISSPPETTTSPSTGCSMFSIM
ncbi:MAG: hypothetical protein AB1793_05295 [Candidatus Thermoplasmatota archaeon]